MAVGGQLHAPVALFPVPTLYWRLGGPQDQSRRVQKISPTTGFEPRTAQPVATWTAPTRLRESWKSNLKQQDIIKSTTHFHGCFFTYPVCNIVSPLQPRSLDLFQTIFRPLCFTYVVLTHICYMSCQSHFIQLNFYNFIKRQTRYKTSRLWNGLFSLIQDYV
jgi:hypothetical protein